MRNDCPEDYRPAEDEVEYLAAFGSRSDAILAICDFDDVPRWRVGELAGCSGGVTDDIEQRKRNWASAAYKRTKSCRQTLPRIAALQQQLQIFRAVGTGKSQTVTRQQMLARLDFIAIHGEPTQSISAIRAKEAMVGTRTDVKAERFLAQLVSEVGPERARRGLEEFNRGYLVYRAPDLFAPDDIDLRYAALEAEHDTDHDGGRSDRTLPNDAFGDGSRAVSTPAAGLERSGVVEATREPAHSGGSRDVMRDDSGTVVTPEELERRQSAIGL